MNDFALGIVVGAAAVVVIAVAAVGLILWITKPMVADALGRERCE